jgi:ssDNA-binding Zn-finger/Zn-ribbon topoisomerase 1
MFYWLCKILILPVSPFKSAIYSWTTKSVARQNKLINPAYNRSHFLGHELYVNCKFIKFLNTISFSISCRFDIQIFFALFFSAVLRSVSWECHWCFPLLNLMIFCNFFWCNINTLDSQNFKKKKKSNQNPSQQTPKTFLSILQSAK